MTHPPSAWTGIPRPSVISDLVPSRSRRDPESGNESGPIEDAPDAVSEQTPGEEVSAYARQLWRLLDSAARYLREDVAPELRGEDAWAAWRERYGAILSVMAGPAGDEGYGFQEARLAHQNARLP